jgi:NADPH:quinone reductase-like Zn-dependent oxidoreductase
MEFAGVVDAIGDDVTRFRPGDPVFGIGLSGANAEWLTIREDRAIAPMPAGLSHAEAAAIPFGALAALAFLRDVAAVRPGERVLVVGAAGGVGVFAVQLARHFGAEVTAVCGAANLDLVRSLGATSVIDRARRDFTTEATRFDIILDTIGVTDPRRCRRVLTARGRHVFLSFGFAEMCHALASRLRPGPRVTSGFSGNDPGDLELLRDMAEARTLRPVIGLTMPIEAVVAAHRHVDGGRKRGSLVLTLGDGSGA